MLRPGILRKISLFCSLPFSELRYLAARLAPLELAADQILFREGAPGEDFYILLEGEVEIFKAAGTAHERSLGRRRAVTLLGEMSLFSHERRRTATVHALTPLLLLRLDRVEFDALLFRQPQLSYELLGLVSKRLEETENQSVHELMEKNESLRQAYEELQAAQEQIIEKEKLDHELEISSQIQQSILPNRVPRRRGYDFGALMIPAHALGGDFYTFLSLDKSHLGIVVGDVCDKDISAALFMSLVYSLIRVEALTSRSPVRVLREVNRHLLQINAGNMFVTLLYGILNCENGRFHYARAAHTVPLLLDADGETINVPVKPGQPLGVFGNLPIDEERITIPPGGTLLLFTDGLNETSDINGKEFGYPALADSLSAARHQRAQQICSRLWEEIAAYSQGLPQYDDFTAVVVKRLTRKSTTSR